MNTQPPKPATWSFFASIPGRKQKRWVTIDELQTYDEVKRRVGSIWGIDSVDDCALVSLANNYEHIITSQWVWQMFFESTIKPHWPMGKLPTNECHLEFRKYCAAPGELELCTPHDAASRVLSAIGASRDSFTAMAAQLVAASKAQAAELAKLTAINQAQAQDLAAIKAASVAMSTQQQQQQSSSSAPQVEPVEDAKDQAIKEMQATIKDMQARMAKLEALITSNSAPSASSVEAVPQAAESESSTHDSPAETSSASSPAPQAPATPAVAATPAPAASAASTNAAAHESVSASQPASPAAPAPAAAQPTSPQPAAAPQQPAEVFENLARSIAQLVGGALQTDVTPFVDTFLNLANGRSPSANVPQPQPASADARDLRADFAARLESVRASRQSGRPDSDLRSAAIGRCRGASARHSKGRAAQPGLSAQAQTHAQKDVKAPFTSPVQATLTQAPVASTSVPAESVTVVSSSPSEDEFEMVDDEELALKNGDADKSGTLVGAFEDMMAEMREARSESYQSHADKGKGKASDSTVQAQGSSNNETSAAALSNPRQYRGRFAFHDELD